MEVVSDIHEHIIKLEPEDPQEDNDRPTDRQEPVFTNEVYIKEDYYDSDGQSAQGAWRQHTSEPAAGVTEITVKQEPIEHELPLQVSLHEEAGVHMQFDQHYRTDGDGDDKKKIPGLFPIRRRRGDDDSSDEEYLPNKKNFKFYKGTRKPPILSNRNKKATTSRMYSEEVLMHIYSVVITEKERQEEHNLTVESKRYMRYLCELCAMGFIVEEAYLTHMKIHTPVFGNHECDICHTFASSERYLYQHRLKHYRRYVCDICKLRYRSKDSACSHVLNTHTHGGFLCRFCKKCFRRPQYLKRHVEQHHTRPLRLQCPYCERVFYERGWYRCHVRTHNEEVRLHSDSRLYKCDFCHREFKHKKHFKRHILMHDRKSAYCELCHLGFKDMLGLKEHYRGLHPGQPISILGEVQCPRCNQVYSTQAMLRKHELRIHGERTKKFQCDHCKRFYRTKGELRNHIMWSHMRRGGHACACGIVFRTPGLLRDHYQKVHTDIKPTRDFKCERCDKAYTNRQALHRHYKCHSDIKYPCNECGMEFKTEAYVKVHYKLKHLNMTRAEIKAETKRNIQERAMEQMRQFVQGVEPNIGRYYGKVDTKVEATTFKCEHCEKVFNNKQVLNRHLKCHSDVKYPCKECGVEFKTEGYVKIHYKLKHLNMTRAEIKAATKRNAEARALQHMKLFAKPVDPLDNDSTPQNSIDMNVIKTDVGPNIEDALPENCVQNDTKKVKLKRKKDKNDFAKDSTEENDKGNLHSDNIKKVRSGRKKGKAKKHKAKERDDGLAKEDSLPENGVENNGTNNSQDEIGPDINKIHLGLNKFGDGNKLSNLSKEIIESTRDKVRSKDTLGDVIKKIYLTLDNKIERLEDTEIGVNSEKSESDYMRTIGLSRGTVRANLDATDLPENDFGNGFINGNFSNDVIGDINNKDSIDDVNVPKNTAVNADRSSNNVQNTTQDFSANVPKDQAKSLIENVTISIKEEGSSNYDTDNEENDSVDGESLQTPAFQTFVEISEVS